MPLPPLPDPARIGGPAHISDSQKLTDYLRALAVQDEVDVTLPDPAAGEGGHIEWHNEMVKAAKKVAAVIGATVNLPPDTVKAKDLEHVTHHNLLTKALADMSAAVPFVVDGGQVYTGDGWRGHVFTTNGVLTVKGSGRITCLVVGGGGGSGWYQATGTFTHYWPGAGGGGSVAGLGVGDDETPLPVNPVSTGPYQIVVGGGGKPATSAVTAGSNGGVSSITGKDLALVAPGGGGGGSSDAPGQSAGTGGGGGGYTDQNSDGSMKSARWSEPGTGNPGGHGFKGNNIEGINPGSGGGCVGNATSPTTNGRGYAPPEFFVSAYQQFTDYRSKLVGTGGSSGSGWFGPGFGSLGALFNTASGTPGIVVVAYPFTELFRAGNRFSDVPSQSQ